METEEEADVCTEEDEKEVDTEELLDMVFSAGRDEARPTSSKTIKHQQDRPSSIFASCLFSFGEFLIRERNVDQIIECHLE